MKWLLRRCIALVVVLNVCNQTPQQDGEKKVAPETKATTQNASTGSAKRCSDVVFEILTTSPRYREIVAGADGRVKEDGPVSFGVQLEGSPDSAADSALSYSETYDYSVHENHADRITVIARFTFDLKTKQLFEHDELADSLKPVAFNKELISTLNASCRK